MYCFLLFLYLSIIISLTHIPLTSASWWNLHDNYTTLVTRASIVVPFKTSNMPNLTFFFVLERAVLALLLAIQYSKAPKVANQEGIGVPSLVRRWQPHNSNSQMRFKEKNTFLSSSRKTHILFWVNFRGC